MATPASRPRGKKLYSLTPEGKAFLDEHRDEARAILSQLEAIGQRMGDVRRAFSGEDDDAASPADIRQAIHALRHALHEKRRTSPEEQKRVVEILRRATEDISASRSSNLNRGSVQVVGLGPVDLHGHDVADPQGPA